ncbi:MAG: hypothetical protein ABEL51_01615 [Salinibacter sp.]
MNRRTDWLALGLLIAVTLAIVALSTIQAPHCPPADGPMGAWILAPWPLKVAFIQGSTALGLLLLTLSRRFAAPMAPTLGAPPRRSNEYIASMAQLLRRAGAHTMAVETLHADLRRTLARTLGLPEHVDTPTLVQAARHQRPALGEEVRHVLEDGEALQSRSSDNPPDEGTVVSWARRCAALRRKWEGRA